MIYPLKVDAILKEDDFVTDLPSLKNTLEPETREFICDFLEHFDEAIRERGLLRNYESTRNELATLCDHYKDCRGFIFSLLRQVMERTILAIDKEKDNDWQKGDTEGKLNDYVAKMRFLIRESE